MGGRSESSSDTKQIDRRIGATDSARVVTEGGQLREHNRTHIRIERADAPVIEAAIGEGGASGIIDTVLAYSSRHDDDTRAVVERTLDNQAQIAVRALEEGEEGLQSLRSMLLAGSAVAVAVAFFASR